MNNLARTELAESQNNKHVTVNDSDGVLDAAMTAYMTFEVSDGTNTLTTSVNVGRAVHIDLIDSATPPGSNWTLVFPPGDRGIVYLKNSTSWPCFVKYSGQVSFPVLLAGGQAIFLATNSTVRKLTGSTSGTTFLDLDDTPSSYSGKANRLLKVAGAEDSIVYTVDMVQASVKYAFTGNITLATGAENGDTVEGSVLATGDDFWATGQTSASENGIYVVQASGAAVRRERADTTGDIKPGMITYVRSGTNAGRFVVVTNAGEPVIGAGSITTAFVGGGALLLDGSTTMTGAIKAAAGSLGSPSITFGADTDTGFDNALGANIGRAQGGGAEAFRWGSSPGLGYGATPDSTYSLPFLLSGSGAALAYTTSNMSNGPMYLYKNSGGCQFGIVGEGANGTGMTIYRAVTSASGANNILLKSRGTPDAPTTAAQNDATGTYFYGFYDSALPGFFLNASLQHLVIAASPSSTSKDARFIWNLGSGSSTVEFMRGDHTGGLQMFGANTIVDINRIIRTRSYTKATLPTITTTGIIYCSDEDGGGCQLFSDGTNWRRVWDRKISGTTNKKKQTIWVPAGAMTPRSTNGCAALASNETTTNKVNYNHLDFDASAIEYAQFSIRMPKSWDESTVTYMIAWCHPSTATNFGVVWGLQGVALSDAEALDTAFGTAVTVTDTGGSTATRYATAESSAVTIGSSPAAEDLVYFQLYRDATNGSDTLAVDAQLLGVSIFYNTDDDTDV
jgi:hypothetical protein